MSKRFWNQFFWSVTVIFGLWLLFDLASHLMVETLWFQEVGYLSVLRRRGFTQLVLLLIGIVVSAAFLLGNIFLARVFKYSNSAVKNQKIVAGNNRDNLLSSSLNLSLLLPIVLLLSCAIGVMLIYYLDVAYDFWQLDFNQPKITPPLPTALKLKSAVQMLMQIDQYSWQLVTIIAIICLLILKTDWTSSVISVALSLIFGLVLSGNWSRILQFYYQTDFPNFEPLFKQNIGFYVFSLPIGELLNFWLGGLCTYALITVSLIYLQSGNSLSEGKFPGFSPQQQGHLYGLSGLVMLIMALRHWLSRYGLLYSSQGVTYGAGYTEVKVKLPAENILTAVALVVACWFIVQAILISKQILQDSHKKQLKKQPINLYPYISLADSLTKDYLVSKDAKNKQIKLKIPVSLVILGVYLLTVLIVDLAFPNIVQVFKVQPNELALETPYIERTIALTRDAFALDKIEAKTFDPQGKLTVEKLWENDLTIDNIRLWDIRPLLQTNRQLQQIRLYYRFRDADIDRYSFKEETLPSITPQFNLVTNNQVPVVTKQQVIIAPRELDYVEVPDEAKTWVNEHLVYTHGYGFTMSPVNQVDEGGLPSYYVKDIGSGIDEGALRTSSQVIKESIPTENPRIYYGELTNTYVMTSTKVQELDFPSGEENTYNIYSGTGGIELKNYGRKVLFAQYLKDWQMLFTRNFTTKTKLLLRRNIKHRIKVIAPFLRYDHDPYLVTVKAQLPNSLTDNQIKADNHLYWMVDAYTTSDRYPYSDPEADDFNYIRNSVKVVIDAYNGQVAFFVADADDPIIQTWTKIFPELFQPLEKMPATLRNHIRYPADLFISQSERLLTYHMTDPQVFYNREDQWQVPQEIYGNEAQSVEPYYLIMKLPTATEEEFVLLLPFTPTSRNNLIAWLAARSDGEQYGKLLLYQFPKQKLVYGIEQVEALINQDPVISQQISLWDRQGSKAIQGNLLVIPVEQSLLYVEPLYLEAEQNSLPTLARVIVVYDNRVVMADSLNKALKAIFVTDKLETSSTIIRPLEAEGLTGVSP